MSEYKHKIDKDALTDFLLATGEPSPTQLAELEKVLLVVMIKHYNKYLYEKEELFQYAKLAVLERRKNYDPAYSSYNYIYTICRNEIGNRINKITKEVFVEDILPMSNASSAPDDMIELPSEVSKFRRYLTGEYKFNFIELTKQEAINLALFIGVHTAPPRGKCPSFIKDTSATRTLYRLLFKI